MSAPIRLRVRSTVDLLAIVPYLLGFHPTDSLVVVAMRGRQMVFAARGDLPEAGASEAMRASFADYLADVVTRQGVEAASVIGYGSADRVANAVRPVCDVLAEAGVQIFDALRVTSGRYWSYFCDDPTCCPPEGVPFDTSTSPLSAEAVFAGQVVLPDRVALARQVAPVEGSGQEAMRLAGERAADRLAELIAAAPGEVRAALLGAGKAAVREALAHGEVGERLTDDELAWLTLLLAHQPVRDFAWERTTPDEWQMELWTDVLRRAEVPLAPAPATLLAFSAWRAGFGALAGVALDRAFGVDPEYPMAVVMEEVLRRGVPPCMLDDWPDLAGPPASRPAPTDRES